MNPTHAHITAGATAADARVRVQAIGNQDLGFGWPSVTSTCEKASFLMARTGNKRPPRRLGQRTT
jgi:hypothetical protein